jgi:hypothetical protein
MWHARFAYLEVAVVGEGGGDLSSSSLGNDLGGGGVSGVPQATRKTPMGAAISGDPSWAVG